MNTYGLKFAMRVVAILLLVQHQCLASITLLQTEPASISVGTATAVTFVAEVAPNSKLIKNSVNLLRQTPQGNKLIGIMHDDGKLGDGLANDNQYSLRVTLNEAVSGPIYFQASAAYKGVVKRELSAPASIQVQLACGPTGNILPVKIFEGDGSGPQAQTIDFDVPKGGKAFLRLVNGARLNAPVAERIALAKFAVNGKPLKTIAKDSNVSEVLVDLLPGHNVLDVQEMIAKFGQRLSARIDTCADTLKLKPVPDTQKVGASLTAEATLTGLGVPVPKAPILFALSGPGIIPTQTVSTDENGIATATMNAFTLEGSATLQASTRTISPTLSDSIPITVVANPSIGVRQSLSNMTMKAGDTGSISIFVDLFKADTNPYLVSFEQFITPNDEGISSVPSGIQSINFEARPVGDQAKPRVKELIFNIKGLSPGSYTIASRATLAATGESVTANLSVNVTDIGLVIDVPTIQPGSIAVDTPASVIFQARTAGGTSPPVAIQIQECAPIIGACADDANDNSWKTIGELYDDGNSLDALLGDGVYSRQLQLESKTEGLLLYRGMVQDNNGVTISKSAPLQVSRFPSGLAPNPNEVIIDPRNGMRMVAEEVSVRFIPGTAPERIEQIVADCTRGVTGKIGSVTGQVPEIGVYQVRLSVNGGLSDAQRAELVSNAVNQFDLYDEVLFAEANVVISVASVPDDGGTLQWGAPRIHADKAWDAVTTPKPGAYADANGQPLPIMVAIVDTGVRDTHQDLSGQIATGSQLGDQYIENNGPGPGHGTGVAAVIAAKHSGTGQGSISGVAYGAQVYSVKGVAAGSTQIDINNGSAGIIAASNKAEVRVINLSWNQFPPFSGVPEPLTLKNALVFAAAQGKLVVSAAGNGPVSGNVGENIPDGVNANSRFPCSWDNLVLCVGNTSVNPPTAVGTYPQQAGAADVLHTVNDVWPGLSCGGIYPSNFGPAVDLYAPGTCIYSATSASISGYSRRTGTSFSAPHVAGAAAVIWAEMGASTTASVVRNQLIQCTNTQVQNKPFLDLFKAVSQKARINLVSGEAGYKNLFGVYNKVNNKARIVHNIQTSGTGQVESFNLMKTLYLTKVEKDNIGYFIIPNGANLNSIAGVSDLNPYADPDLTVAAVQQGNATVYCLQNNAGVCLIGQDAYAYFSELNKNPDGQVHVRNASGGPFDSTQSGKQFWEDLPLFNQTGDFNDAVIQIDFGINCP